MSVPRKTGRVRDDSGGRQRGAGTDSVSDNGLGRVGGEPGRGPGPDQLGPESDILQPKR